MKYRPLAETGVFVSEPCLGAMTLAARARYGRTLSADDLNALGEASAVAPEYPAWMDALGSDRRSGETRY